MYSKVIVKEMDDLKQALMNLREDINQTMQKTASVDDQYVKSKAEHEIEMLSLAKILSKQQEEIDKLEDLEADLDIKLQSLGVLISEQQTTSREEADELQRTRNENAEEVTSTKKIMNSLNDSIKKTKLDLEYEEEYMANLEQNFETTKATRAKEVADKLEKIRGIHAARMKAVQEKYNAKIEPMMYRIKCLDEDIEKLETEIMKKPEEEALLKRQHSILEKKLDKAAMARLLLECDLTMMAVEKTLSFFLQNPSVARVEDVQFGIALAKSNLLWIFDQIQARLGRNHVVKKKLSTLMEMSNKLLKMNTHTSINSLLIQELSKTEAEDISYGSLMVQDIDYSVIRFDSCQNIQSNLMRGTHNDSDFCIRELYESDCQASDKCWFSKAISKIHSGYETSHRLIYLLAASKLHCDAKNGSRFAQLKEMKRKLCQQMLHEARILEQHAEFLAVQDLFLEQVALCGLEGFGEFGSENWRKKVRTWQGKKGCFGQNGILVHCSIIAKSFGLAKAKRTDFKTGDCHSHLTAAALAAMAFHLRLILNALYLTTYNFL